MIIEIILTLAIDFVSTTLYLTLNLDATLYQYLAPTVPNIFQLIPLLPSANCSPAEKIRSRYIISMYPGQPMPAPND